MMAALAGRAYTLDYGALISMFGFIIALSFTVRYWVALVSLHGADVRWAYSWLVRSPVCWIDQFCYKECFLIPIIGSLLIYSAKWASRATEVEELKMSQALE